GRADFFVCPYQDQLIQKYEFSTVKNKTASFGVTSFNQIDNIKMLIKRADDYLYQAKQEGRNRVISG
ncbi:response regulator containing a CheY-like receiver domain and a GGDEF domain, partial [Thiovulum sp. ES]